MRRLFILGLVCWCVAVQAAEHVVTLPPFTAIKSEGVFDLDTTVGQKQSVVFSGTDEKFRQLQLSVINNVLHIIAPKESKGWGFFREDKLKITIPSLHAFDGSGIGSASIKKIQGEKFTLHFEGAGTLTASGEVTHLEVKSKGVGEINLKKLRAKTVQVNLEGVGETSVYASERLDAKVQGVGALIYYGRPKVVNKEANGIGNIRSGE